MSVDRFLLQKFITEYPFQPATAFWRAIEVAQLSENHFPPGTGLDLGCGDGKLTLIVMDRIGKRILVGVDMDPQETEQARQLGLYERVHTAPADRVPEPDNAFDFVFSNSVLEHIDDIQPVLDEVGRLLKVGGRFIFTVPGNEFHACLRGPLMPGVTRADYLAELDRRCAHKRYWGLEVWSNHLVASGMQIKFTGSYISVAEIQRWETISRFTAGVLYLLFRRRKHPIEIQRALGLRKAGAKMPVPLAKCLAPLILLGLNSKPVQGQPYGCLLVVAEKTARAV